MAETLLFDISKPTSGTPSAVSVLWFQSSDGLIWSTTPVDTVLISTLLIDATTKKYIWGSLLANPLLYHQLKTEDGNGDISIIGTVIPPRPSLSYNMPSSYVTGVQLDKSSEVVYNLGDTIDLILRLDNTAINFGATLPVDIIDVDQNIIASLTAKNIGGTTYVTEWTIPLNVQRFYDLTGNDNDNYHKHLHNHKNDRFGETLKLFDQWHFIDGSNLTFPFSTYTTIDNPQSDNAIINIEINGLQATDNSILEEKEIHFSTNLNPYYATVNDVMRGEYGYLLEDIDPMDVAMEIVYRSQNVDLQMRPNRIHYHDIYNQSVRNYVRLTVLRYLLTPLGITSSTEKMLDTFKVANSYGDPAGLIKELDVQAKEYAKFIWAGGKDTPFIPKLFEKGLYDPNRPKISRANLDTQGWYPWTNHTTEQHLMNIDGNEVEVRGTRTTSYGFIFNKYCSYSGGAPDQGDVGYLSNVGD